MNVYCVAFWNYTSNTFKLLILDLNSFHIIQLDEDVFKSIQLSIP